MPPIYDKPTVDKYDYVVIGGGSGGSGTSVSLMLLLLFRRHLTHELEESSVIW